MAGRRSSVAGVLSVSGSDSGRSVRGTGRGVCSSCILPQQPSADRIYLKGSASYERDTCANRLSLASQVVSCLQWWFSSPWCWLTPHLLTKGYGRQRNSPQTEDHLHCRSVRCCMYIPMQRHSVSLTEILLCHEIISVHHHPAHCHPELLYNVGQHVQYLARRSKLTCPLTGRPPWYDSQGQMLEAFVIGE